MTTFWQNFGIWAELDFGTNFWALFWALSVGVVNSKGSQNVIFWNILKYLNILSKSFILSKYLEPAFPSEAVGAKAPSVLPAPRVSSSINPYWQDFECENSKFHANKYLLAEHSGVRGAPDGCFSFL